MTIGSLPGGCIFARCWDRLLEKGFVVWRADWDPSVVALEAVPADPNDPDAFDITQLACPVLVLREFAGVEHLLIGDGACHIRLDIAGGTVLAGPVRLRFEFAGLAGMEAKLLTLRRLVALVRLGRFPRGLFPLPPARRARRWMMALRALDARRAGATHREIASALFGEAMVAADWDGSSAYLRCRVQRLIRLGEALVQGGYRDLLR